MSGATRSAVRTTASLVLIGLCAGALHLAGTGDLAAPPAGMGALLDWVDARTPLVAAIALVRLVAELVTWYVLAATVAHVAGSCSGRPGIARLADALTVPMLRGAMGACLGLGVAAAPALAAPLVGTPAVASAVRDTAPAPGVATMDPVVPGDSRPTGADSTPPRPDGVATMSPAPPPTTTTPRTTAVVPTTPTTSTPSASTPASSTPPPTTWTVTRGECFWSIAEDALVEHLGRPVTDAEVVGYWHRLIEVNHGRLVDPGDPDLLLPGQVLDVPVPATLP